MRIARLALGAGLAGLLACSAAETGPAAPGTTDGRTSVFLTDAPFPFEGVSRVDIHVVSIALALHADTSDAGLPWVAVATPDRTFNLLELQNGTTSLLGGAVIPPGDYRAVRLIFDPERSSITDAAGHQIVSTTTPGTPGIDWQAKGGNPSLFAQVEEPVAIDEVPGHVGVVLLREEVELLVAQPAVAAVIDVEDAFTGLRRLLLPLLLRVALLLLLLRVHAQSVYCQHPAMRIVPGQIFITGLCIFVQYDYPGNFAF